MSRMASAFRHANFHPKALAAAIALALGATATHATAEPLAELTARAVLPAATFAPGPTSGQHLGAGPINSQPLPFLDKQPVQGFSAVLRNKDGSFLAMPDNGYGSIENSADFNLRAYKIAPSFKTANAGTSGDGSIAVQGFIQLRDPDHKVPFAIVNEFTRQRVLTGADFDIESMRLAKDGTLWFGEEFGPFLLHFSANGRLLEAPIALPDFENPGHEVRSPQNPYYEEASAVRVMNAVHTHAQQHGNAKTPVFSPNNVMLKYAAKTSGANPYPASNPNLHPQRGTNTPAGLAPAASDIFDVKSIQAAGYPVVTWTVNDPARMDELLKVGVNGIISDDPDLLFTAVKNFDANGDGTPGDYLGADGLVDTGKFDLQAHRGGRNLRPENTLPSMEVGLDSLATTLETDTGITKDGIPVLSHDPYIEAAKCRRADGQPYTLANQALIKNMTVAQIQSTFICDNLLAGRPRQTNDRTLSPVAVAFAASHGLADPYVKPTAQQLFDFVAFYVDYYQNGAGQSDPNATPRWKNAAKVRFNIETKINPRSDQDAEQGRVYKDRTIGPKRFADILAGVIEANGMTERADIQSFDFRTLLRVQERHPNIRTVYLFTDSPIFTGSGANDGGNLQDENGANTPWLGGLHWPYRSTFLTTPPRAQSSGGFEGMALSMDRSKLLPLLEKPLAALPGNPASKVLKIHEFDLASKQYTGASYDYPLELNGDGSFKGTSIGDFTLHGKTHGLVIERDNFQGAAAKFKAIYDIQLGAPGQPVAKTQVVDLLNIADPNGISLGAPSELAGDLGLGTTFSFPFVTIEDVVVLDSTHIGVINDNNYPFSLGRHIGTGMPDDNEFITLKLSQPLPKD